MSTEPEKLLPCPFCGNPNVNLLDLPHAHVVRCVKCTTATSEIWADSKAEAIAAWNHRPAPSPDGWAMAAAKEVDLELNYCAAADTHLEPERIAAIISRHAPPAPASSWRPTDEQLKEAMQLDFQQQVINSLTPDRGYGFPIDNVRELLDSMPSGWRPIEEAPREHGKSMLVFCSERMNTYTAYWSTYPDEGHWRHFGGSGPLIEQPTHFMPLPPPPGHAAPMATDQP